MTGKISDNKSKCEHITPHEAALRELNVNPGCQVRILGRFPSLRMGWTEVWCDEMDEQIGSCCTVLNTDASSGVQLDCNNLWYPAFVLERTSISVCKFRGLDVSVSCCSSEVTIGTKTYTFDYIQHVHETLKELENVLSKQGRVEVTHVLISGDSMPLIDARKLMSLLQLHIAIVGLPTSNAAEIK